MQDFFKELNSAVTVSSLEGIVLYQNDRSKAVNGDVVGKNMRDCHKATSVAKIDELQNQKTTNVYTIEKKGVKKLIYQSPWYENGVIKGLAEFSIEIPFEMPHFVRSPPENVMKPAGDQPHP